MTVVIDTSALVAVVFGEPDAAAILGVMSRHVGDLVLSAATAVEVGIVVEAKQGPLATADLRLLIAGLQIRVVVTVAVGASGAGVTVEATGVVTGAASSA